MEDDIDLRPYLPTAIKFQSTPSHGGWHMLSKRTWPQLGISIHTLTWRMTEYAVDISKMSIISIHILTWRMTLQPPAAGQSLDISIHILTWRMTCAYKGGKKCRPDFNPHPHMEDDLPPWYILISCKTFQSTSSHGGWRTVAQPIPADWIISIHILTWRMTWPWRHYGNSSSYFNPHPHMEDDQLSVIPSFAHQNFNPHPHMEDDAIFQAGLLVHHEFQSTSSHGGWLVAP